jgi:hypothetical protein
MPALQESRPRIAADERYNTVSLDVVHTAARRRT